MKIENVYLKKGSLCLMMFMQYVLIAVWWVPLAAYLKALHFEGFEFTLIMSAMAIGSMISPFVGALADKYYSSEKVLMTLNLLTAVSLIFAATQTTFIPICIGVMLAMCCHMPTWGLTSSITMSHLPSEQFPRIRIFGSIGWVASGLFSIVAVNVYKIDNFEISAMPLYCGAAIALIAAAFNLFLPSTPPAVAKITPFAISDLLGLSVLSKIKNRNFYLFVSLSFLSIIPFSLHHAFGSLFLDEMGFKNLTVTMNWGPFAEIFFLFITTSILVKFGIKKTLILGLVAMILRYMAFFFGVEYDCQELYYLGILVHGLIFGLFYTGGQVYADRISTPEIKAQVQSFLFFSIWGVGYLIGTIVNGSIISFYRVGERADWATLFMISSVFTVVLLLAFLLLFKEEKSIETK